MARSFSAYTVSVLCFLSSAEGTAGILSVSVTLFHTEAKLESSFSVTMKITRLILFADLQ